jgi:hypothetical protein
MGDWCSHGFGFNFNPQSAIIRAHDAEPYGVFHVMM